MGGRSRTDGRRQRLSGAVASYALFLIVLLRLIVDGRGNDRSLATRRVALLFLAAILIAPVVDYRSIAPTLAALILITLIDAAILLFMKNPHLARTVSISAVTALTLLLLRDVRVVGGVSPVVEAIRAFIAAGRPEGAAEAAAATNALAGGVFQFAAGALIAGFEANHLVAYVLEKLKLGPAAPRDQHQLFAPKDAGRGRAIGILERLIVFGLVVTGNAMAVMFVLTAKAFTRFRELDSRDFAEYVLIGTLMSVGLAALVGAVFGFLL